MNLENLNLVELNAQEVQEVQAGGWQEWAFEIADHWGDIKKGFIEGYNKQW